MFTPGLIILALFIIILADCITPWWFFPVVIIGAILTMCLKKR